MQRKTKQGLSFILSFLLVLSFMPGITVFADETDGGGQPSVESPETTSTDDADGLQPSVGEPIGEVLIPEQPQVDEDDSAVPLELEEDSVLDAGSGIELLDADHTVINVLAEKDGVTATVRKANIIAKWNALFANPFIDTNRFSVSPLVTAPYAAGTLKPAYESEVLGVLNFNRYLAGVPDDVVIDPNYALWAQAGAVLLAASTYSHTPPKPADMSNEFYDLAYKGPSQGNIAYGYNSLDHSILDGWMADEDAGNIVMLGHRRWVLNPRMAKTGFGEASSDPTMYVMYAFDSSRAATAVDYEAIAYPSGKAFPNDFFGGNYPWSITLNPSYYKTTAVDLSSVTVTLQHEGQTWTFNSSDTNTSGKYFNINTDGYGVANCIVFRPTGITSYEGTYTVTVSGVKTSSNQATTFSYSVDFFSLFAGAASHVTADDVTLTQAEWDAFVANGGSFGSPAFFSMVRQKSNVRAWRGRRILVGYCWDNKCEIQLLS